MLCCDSTCTCWFVYREEQWINVVTRGGEEAVLPYDYLVLCTGTQYMREAAHKETADGKEEEEVSIPRQVFALGSREQSLQLMDWMKQKLAPVDNGKLSMAIIWLCIRNGSRTSVLVL